MQHTKRIAWALAAMLALACPLNVASANESIVLSCWVYYNGVQEKQFSSMVQEFNNTRGRDIGVFVEYSSKGSIAELDAQARASALNEPGAEKLPDLYTAYADTTYAMRQYDVVADLSPYLTEEELAEYIDAYIEEGRMGAERELCIFPAAKSTELLLLNKTEWDAFAAATGAQEEKLLTWEGLAELGESFYRWTDALTPETEGDGRAFFGRDSMANYLLIGSMQLGCEIFRIDGDEVTIDFNRDAMRRIWDCFYVPYASGWYTAEGRYRSDDVKTGRIIALVGSTSGAVYFPTEVTFDDGTSQAIESSVRALPNFAGAEPYAVQQGAGFVVSKSVPAREAAAVAFLRWFTEPERNIAFAIGSGYLPVTKKANQPQVIYDAMDKLDAKPLVRELIQAGANITNHYRLYTNKPFRYGYEAREVLNNTLINAAMRASAERQELMAGGKTYDEAIAELTTEEAFEAWYTQTKADLEKAVYGNE